MNLEVSGLAARNRYPFGRGIEFSGIGFEIENYRIALRKLRENHVYPEYQIRDMLEFVSLCEETVALKGDSNPEFLKRTKVPRELLLTPLDEIHDTRKEGAKVLATQQRVSNVKCTLEIIARKNSPSDKALSEAINFFDELSEKCLYKSRSNSGCFS
ncbi:MAG: hypothetical protein KKF68_02050 [Nanoarchaeota archaeon]|nr:hypothetical protein [Nanoarchaeota archaeon]